RSARYLGIFRFVGISIAFAMNGLLLHLLPAGARYQSDVRLFACYWVVAAGIFWTTRRPQAGRFIGLDVALVDMPFAFALEADVVLKNPTETGPAIASAVFSMLLVMAAAFSLDRSRIVLAAAVGAGLEVGLLLLAPDGAQFMLWAVPSI